MASTSRRTPRRPERPPGGAAARPALEPVHSGAVRLDEGAPLGGAASRAFHARRSARRARAAPLQLADLALDQTEARKDPGLRGFPGAEVDEDRAEQPTEGVRLEQDLADVVRAVA